MGTVNSTVYTEAFGIDNWVNGVRILEPMFRYLQPCGVGLENYLLHLYIRVVPCGKCFSSTKLEFGLKCVLICRPVPLWG